MDVIVQIPDDLAKRLGVEGRDLSRRMLEGLALEEFKLGHLTQPELRRLLGFNTRYELDGFLKRHGVYEAYTMADFEREQKSLDRLGL